MLLTLSSQSLWHGLFLLRIWTHPYMPYLILWDKISQNLAILQSISHQNFKSHRIFRPSKRIFYEELYKYKLHNIILLICLIHQNKGFKLISVSLKVIFMKISQNFVKSPLKLSLISQRFLPRAYGIYAHPLLQIGGYEPSHLDLHCFQRYLYWSAGLKGTDIWKIYITLHNTGGLSIFHHKL